MLEEMLTEAGIDVNRNQFEQAQLLNNALGGTFDMLQWRNHPGGDPDGQYNWWATASPVNFGTLDDPELQALPEPGPPETDPAHRTALNANLNRRLAEPPSNPW